MIRVVVLLIIAVLGWHGQASAQQTREAERAAAQAEKAKALHPYTPGALERYAAAIEKAMADPPPIYTFIGGVYPGGALALGPGARYRTGNGLLADVHGAWSIKNYKLVDASIKLPPLADRRLLLEGHANWLDAPKVTFFGLGRDSQEIDETTFLYRTATAGGSGRVRLLPFVTVGGGMDLLDVTTAGGRSETSIEQRFSPPGLDADPTYAWGHAFAEMDWRSSPGYTRRGGLYRVDWSSYRQRDDGPYSFSRVDGEVDHFIPLQRESWVIALRALASVTSTDDGDEVPYFLMPSLGGGRELRGYASWRFRDRNRAAADRRVPLDRRPVHRHGDFSRCRQGGGAAS